MFQEVSGEANGKLCGAAFAAFLNSAYHGLLDRHVPGELADLVSRIPIGEGAGAAPEKPDGAFDFDSGPRTQSYCAT
jgi:hypothetical protein